MQSFGAYNEEPKGQNDGIPVYAKLVADRCFGSTHSLSRVLVNHLLRSTFISLQWSSTYLNTKICSTMASQP